nr:hypothetical protein [uncultured Allomuricauda sp.]
MIITVVRYYKWPPPIVENLYLDDFDYNGLEFWFNDAKDQDKKTKELLNNKNGRRT